MLIYKQFGIIQNIPKTPVSQTSFLSWTFCAASYSKIALVTVCLILLYPPRFLLEIKVIVKKI